MITIADAILHAFDHHLPMAPITESDPDFDLARAYAVQAELTATRLRRGGRVVGVKTGFTNTTIWDDYNVHAPIHGPVFDTSWRKGPLPVADFLEPRIEPEIVLRLGASPEPGMDLAALKGCVDAVARAFEIVQSPFPGWRFRAPDTVAAGALHGALVTGEFVAATPALLDALASLEVTLIRDGAPMDRGHARDVLDGPLTALRHLVELLDEDPDNPPLGPGEFVTTGTVTRAFDIRPREQWQTLVEGLPLPGLRLDFR